MYLEEPENTVQILTLDMPIYNPDTDSKCKTPSILGFAVEDSEFVLAGGQELLEGVQLVLSTGETANVINGLAFFELNEPLTFGQELWVEVNTDDCKTRSCSIYVPRIASFCIESASDKPAGELTGKYRCIESDLYAEVYDGDGGVEAGSLVQENCRYCPGGTLPNCLEPPTTPTTFYDVVRCSDLKVYQTDTVLTVANQRVNSVVFGTHYWNGNTRTSAPAYIGDVSILSGETLCPSVPSVTYYNIKRCSDNKLLQTTTPLSATDQRVSHATGEHVYLNTYTTVVTENIGPVVIMPGVTGCS